MAVIKAVVMLWLTVASLSGVCGVAYKYDHLFNMMKSIDFARTVPVMEQGEPVKVSVKLAIDRVVAMDQDTQEMVADAVLRLRWNDFRVAWNQYMTSSVNTLVWPIAHSTWTPDIVVMNGPGSVFDSSPETNSLFFDHFGNVTWYRRLRLRVPCDVVHQRSNGGEVTCLVTLASWSHDTQDLQLVTSHSYPEGGVSADDDEEIFDKFRVTRTAVTKSSVSLTCCPAPFDVIHYRITVASVSRAAK